MSLNEKYTQEELDAIPPFTGFHHNKTKQDLINEASDRLRNCDNLDGLVFKKAKSKKSTEPSLFLLDEIGQMKIQTPCYDAPPIPLNYKDEVSPFGRVNLWDFEPLTKPGIKFDYPAINKDIAEAFDLVVEKFKNENQPRDVIHNIVDKIHERKLSGKECEVAIMSYSDYHALQSMHDFKIHSVWIAGYLLKIHPSPNLKDGEIEIY